MPLQKQSFVVPPASCGRLDRALHLLTALPWSQVRGLITGQCVTLNGALCAALDAVVQPEDKIELTFDSHQRYHEKIAGPKGCPFTIVHEDEHLMVVDKAARILTVPTAKREKNTLIHALQQYVSRGKKVFLRVEIVHRLDRGVSGLLVFARNGRVAEALRTQFAAHTTDREYVAIVAGRLETDSGTFRTYLATGKNLSRYSTDDPEKGELAITHYRVETRLHDTTVVRVRLETGRRNQIRVHFAEAGHPVLGDPRYSPDEAKHRRWRCHRLALHAATLGFEHPTTGKRVSFSSLLPSEFLTFRNPS